MDIVKNKKVLDIKAKGQDEYNYENFADNYHDF